jgi:hypothetical protein
VKNCLPYLGSYIIVGKQLIWLGRQDSNLGMAESKSGQFRFAIKAHSEKSGEFDPFPLNRLDVLSEWN